MAPTASGDGDVHVRCVSFKIVATVAIESMKFITPILLGDIVSVYAREERRGRTSIAIRIDVVATRGIAQQQIELTSGVYTFVALDANHRPRPLPQEGTM